MKTANLGDYFLFEGQLVRCEWINEGNKSIGFNFKRKITCPHCNHEHEVIEGYDVIESSPMFQNGAKPIQTITEK